MLSDFSIVNLNKLGIIKKKYLDFNSLLYKKVKILSENIIMSKEKKFLIIKTKISKNKLKLLIDTFWVYNGVYKVLNELDSEYVISWGNNKIFIKCTKTKFFKIMKRLKYLIKFIDFIRGDNTEELNIFLVLSSLKKYMDNELKITPKNINSGYTDIQERFIFIWREEEFEKVLFHELIHFFSIDHQNEIYDHFSEYDSLYEAITDFKAIIYNCIYISYITKYRLSKILNYEFSFIINQGIMINNYVKKNIKLVSPAFSYYVLKSMLIKYIVSDQFTENEYNDLFIYNNNFNKIIKKLNKLKENLYIDFNSCRMTFFELE
jgi:hypothetical protein